ncbi:23 kDa jasmonate-induced protein-like [Prunus yedoensis var. nudiflora]|uniref:23 kDa jasmonate-induced protein-like n=1 Tax=Prunus yedoensis var. nudiflora TaxID=2094558 RepID=A0A314US79_PRUYE|nr:23 kDa jasmonate-induced protein-like [Prunus yedoensis var. nudiflora]
MAYNVFGDPIENSTLKGMPEYKCKAIEKKDRAKVALQMKNVGDKDLNAITFVENLKQQHGDGISTRCLIYNATGETLTYAISKDWWGQIGPSPYPALIANGQWGAFLHVQKLGTFEGSVATVVYKGTNKDGQVHGWLLAWSNNRVAYKNTVDYFRFGSYSLSNYRSMLPWSNNGIAGKNMSRTATHYLDNVDWIPLIYDYVNKSGINKSETWNGCFSTVSTGSGTSPIVEAIFMLEDA